MSMNCAYHVDRQVQGVCSTCGRPICEECLVALSGQVHCKHCLTARMRKPSREVNGFVRFVLSVAPGLAHLYMGLFQRGFQFMVGGTGLAIVVGMLFPPLLGLYIPALIFFSIFDAREAHLRMEQGLEVEDKGFVDLRNMRIDLNQRYIAYGLIGIGALALWRTLVWDIIQFFSYRLAQAANGLFVGAVAVAAGIWMLRRNGSTEDSSQ